VSKLLWLLFLIPQSWKSFPVYRNSCIGISGIPETKQYQRTVYWCCIWDVRVITSEHPAWADIVSRSYLCPPADLWVPIRFCSPLPVTYRITWRIKPRGRSGETDQKTHAFPITVHTIVRSRPVFTSHSIRTICCHVPHIRVPAFRGMVSEGPTRAAFTCERPLPSPQRAL